MPNDSKKIFTSSGIEIKEAYTEKDLAPDFQSRLGSAGEFPYTRGIHPNMYRGKLWTMRQYSGFGSAQEANKRFQYLLKSGTTGLSVAFDLPTQMGRDCDHRLARGEVGRVGVSISSIQDMEVLLKDIPLDKVSISMTINATAAILLGFLLVVAERRNVPWSKLQGTIQNDILKEYIARGTYIFPPQPGLRLVTDIFEFCADQVPQWNTISVSGYHIREAGSTAAQEIAFTLGNALAYVSAAIDRGLKIDDFAPRLAFFFNCHNNFFEEIAKFRAARRLWATLLKERYHPKEARSTMLRFHTQTAGSSLIASQPFTNVVRTSMQALAAVLGGTQSLHTNAYDEALCLPSEESALLALRTQQIIALETGVPTSVDPLAGSFMLESLTDQLEQAARQELQKIESLGGMVAAISQGYPQAKIETAAYEYQQAIENQSMKIVGLNVHTEAKQAPIKIEKIKPSLELNQLKRHAAYKRARSPKKLEYALKELKNSAREQKSNLMPVILAAIRADATLGEISDGLREVFGEQH